MDADMTFLVLVTARPGLAATRAIARPEHRAYLSGFGSKLLVSGALMADDNKTMGGGASLIDVAAYEEAQACAHNEPEARAGIRRALDQFNLGRSRDDLLLVLQPVTRADFDDLCFGREHGRSSTERIA